MDKNHHPEEILERIGGCGRFQVFLSVMSHLMKLPTVLTMYLMVISIATPEWRCMDDNGPSHVTAAFNTTFLHVNSTYANSSDIDYFGTANHSKPYNNIKACENRNGTRCNNIVYSDEMKTIVSEWSMSCTLPWVPSTIASIQMLAILFGNLACGQIADSFGRKMPLFSSQLLLIAANLIGYFSTSWLMFGVARAICGIGMGMFLTVQYSLSTEVSVSSWRPWIVAFPTWALMACGLALVSYLMPDWRKLHLLTTIVTIPYLLLWWYFPESFRWHLSHDRTHVAKDIIQRIAKFNKKSVNDETILELLNTTVLDEKSGDRKKYSLWNLFNTRRLAKITVLSMTNWLALGLLSYGIQYGIKALSGNFFFNLFLFNIISVPTTFIAIILSNK
ncbi:solute carrier family 22 member 4-like [Ruditapes philippinarum]|uniref:solute carrier family 22 member 4-like n=1 Tax=Ruditapes philippinarum TaxID=129788 RepID=UPI00295A5C7B|nr:solute carrier family 22 member 4-like [Ruditapes philippinarum]